MTRPSWPALIPDLARGLRAAIATIVPFYLARTWGVPELAWTALGGWLAALADPGGLRETRARAISAFAIAGAAIVAVTEAVAATPFAVPVLFVLALGASLLRVLGSAAASIGTLLVVTGAISLGRVGGDPVREALAFFGGAAWGMLLSSIVWPVWEHLPVRVPLAKCWTELEAYVGAIDHAVAGEHPSGDDAWIAIARENRRRVRAALEEARALALESRSRRAGESVVGSNLRTLLALADRLLPLLVARNEELEALPPGERASRWNEVSAKLSLACAEIARHLSTPVISNASGGATAPPPGDLNDVDAVTRLALGIARHLGAPATGPALSGSAPLFADPVRLVRDALSWRASEFRHALRVAIAATLAQLIGVLVAPVHVHWITVTTLGVLQPYSGATLRRGVERVVGTILGSFLAVAIAATVRSPLVLALVMIPLSVAAVVTKPRSYRLFTLFLTPVFVLIAGNWAGDRDVAVARVAATGIGGFIALAAALVFPRREAPRMSLALQKMRAALRDYAAVVLDAGIAGKSGAEAVSEARRHAGIVLGDVEATLERLLSEPLRSARHAVIAEAAMQSITQARRFGGAVTAFEQRPAAVRIDPDEIRLVRDRVARLLGPDPAPEPALSVAPPLARILHQAELLSGGPRPSLPGSPR